MLKFDEPLSTSLSGCGMKLIIFWPTGLIRLAGMMLPGNGTPVSGSRMTTAFPLRRRPEKSPPRSAIVGTRKMFCCGWLLTGFSPGEPPAPPALGRQEEVLLRGLFFDLVLAGRPKAVFFFGGRPAEPAAVVAP